MTVEITVPDLGESISEVEIGEWLVEQGSWVKMDEELVELESDKATVELPSPEAGRLVEIIKKQGETAAVGEVIARLEPGAEGEEQAPESSGERPQEKPPAEEAAQVEAGKSEALQGGEADTAADSGGDAEGEDKVMPAAARIMAQHRIEPGEVTPSGPGGRILKEDAQRVVAERQAREREAGPEKDGRAATAGEGEEVEERRVPMTPIRRTIANRLLDASRNMALLTTFNEVDMSAVKQARAEFGEPFAAKHGVRLGFMSFFVRASVAALLDFPKVNARIDGRDIVYRNSCDIGVAIGGGKGLVVPVLRRAETMSFAAIEKKIAEYAGKAKENSLSLQELEGGTFTISNGGVYGSMLSTPIVNPPQSAILGLHAINDRPVAVAGEVQIRPVMYLALSYDHRIIDGREAVTFLKSIKERIEQPQRLLLEI